MTEPLPTPTEIETSFKIVRREPALLIGLAVSLLSAVGFLLTSGGAVTWAAIVPLVTGILIRFVVSPAGHE